MSAGVVAKLIARGTLKEDGLITDYVPELKATGFKGATICQLLDMRSGVLWDYESPGEQATWPRWERAAGLTRKRADEATDHGMYHFLANGEDMKQQTREHGSLFYCKDSDTMALVWACERVNGKRFADLLGEIIWSKIVGERDALITYDALNTHLYSREQTDQLTGLQYFRARYYSPATGAFNRLDPFAGCFRGMGQP